VEKLDGRLTWGEDLSPADERAIVEMTTSGKAPIFVTRFPTAIKFFNMETDPADPRCVLSVDLILPVAGEAAGGAQRIRNGARLKQRLSESEMYRHHVAGGGSYADFKPYVDKIEQERTPLHSGCGFGAERIIQGILRRKDIRLCSTDYMSKLLFSWDSLGIRGG
jgi:asparaginyl-tRNA synthetase